MRSLAPRVALIGACSLVPALSCSTYRDDLTRSQRAFESSEHERALAILRSLEGDVMWLSVADRARYAYLRGMTDYRIGYRAEARHWLAVAAALDEKTPDSLPPDWEKRMNDSLRELNEGVYTRGIASLSEPAQGETTTEEGSGSLPDGGAP